MNYPFAFNDDLFDFWPIYEALQRYYPLGMKKERGNGYYRYPGTKAKEKLLVEYVHNREAYQKGWVHFCQYIEGEIGLPVASTTLGQAPSLGAEVVLLDQTMNHVKHVRSLRFNISLLGPFYQIFGVDKTYLIEAENQTPLQQFVVNLVTPSPHGAFEVVFSEIEKLIQERHPDYRILPFFVHQMYVDGLQVAYNDEAVGTVGEALFDDFLRLHEYAPLDRETQYGASLWVRPGVRWPSEGVIS